MSAFRRVVSLGLVTAAVAVPLQFVAATDAHAALASSKITLENGWTTASGTGSPSASVVQGVVTLNGAIRTAGTNPVAFTLSSKYRPSTNAYVSVDFAGGDTGRLYIQPSGLVTVEADGGDFSDAHSFVSLAGASFATSTAFFPLALVNGWTNGPFGTSSAEVKDIAGVVVFKGAVAGGSAATITTLPSGFRPPATVFLPVNLCNSVNGQLEVQTNGVVTVSAESRSFSDASCFTSLDGVSFAKTTSGFEPLTLQSGWSDAPAGTSPAGAQEIGGVVHLQGAIQTGGANRVPTTLPADVSPPVEAYVKVNVCNAVSGQLGITFDGAVVMNVEGMNFPPVNCVISLDGVTFPGLAFTRLSLHNGWKSTSSAFNTPGVGLLTSSQGKIVVLQGEIGSGTSAVAFTLPSAYRPSWNVYVPVNLCGGGSGPANGRLYIQSDGTVTVQAETSFSDAQTCTVLDGVSFVLKTTSGFGTTIELQNGWTSGQTSFGTFQPSENFINNVAYLQGAVFGGTSDVIGTVAFRPTSTVFIPVDECDATNGRLEIDTNGTVTVEGNLSDAQCFTSLDGASFGTTNPPTTLTLLSGWTGGPFGTAMPAVDDVRGYVRFVGAMSTTGTNNVPFVMPVGFRPSKAVNLKVDLCNATNGDLVIRADGSTAIYPEGGTFSNVQCFTSLDGVSFAR
jgi:hypothetical protein